VQNDPGLGPTRIYNTRDQRRLLFGLEGHTDWFDNSFKWNAYYQVGTTKQYAETTHNTQIANFMRAVDVVRNPATGGVPGIAAGTPVCRSTIADPTNGCVPFNVFGSGSASQAALNYVGGAASYQTVYIQQDVASGSVQFEPFSLPAGKVSVAAGYEWRKEQYKNTVDPIDAATTATQAPFWFGNYKVGHGKIKVNEAFVEVVVPVLKDVFLAKELDFNGAVRKTDYSSTGKVTTWKYGATWDVNDELRLRGTKSRDIRAPNLNDLFLGATGSGVGVLAPGTNSQVFINNLSGGNPNLQNEIADTTSAGVVYRPNWFPGFSGSVDYYKIGINDAIVTLTSQQIVNLCYGVGQPASPAACANVIINDPGGSLAGAIVLVSGANIAKQDVAGYDIELSYRRPLSEIPFLGDLPGSIELRSLINKQTEFSQTVGTTTVNLNNMVFPGTFPVAGGPEWRALTTATYQYGPSTTTLAMRYVGATVINHEPASSSLSVTPNDIKSITYFDLAESYNIDAWGVNAQLYAKIENLLDSKPPRVASTQGTAYAASGTDQSYFDLIGRFWRVGVRFKF
jgi:outer membrane receptor protein involved in Fe transport